MRSIADNAAIFASPVMLRRGRGGHGHLRGKAETRRPGQPGPSNEQEAHGKTGMSVTPGHRLDLGPDVRTALYRSLPNRSG